MPKFSMTCSCGHEMSVDAVTREEGVANMKAVMTQDAVDQHLADKHSGEPKMTVAQVHGQIEQMLAAAPA